MWKKLFDNSITFSISFAVIKNILRIVISDVICHQNFSNCILQWNGVIDLFLCNSHDDSKQFKSQIERK